MNEKKYLSIAVILMAIAISLGAMGAHYLKETLELPIEKLESWKTGVFYQIIHAFGIIAAVLIHKTITLKNIKSIVNLYFIGTICFSGSIYLLTLNHIWQIDAFKFLGPITPLGGLLFIAGWIVMFLNLIASKN